MTEGIPNSKNYVIEDQTPDQASQAIADSLVYLSQEADKIGMSEVRDLLLHAAGMAKEFAATSHEKARE